MAWDAEAERQTLRYLKASADYYEEKGEMSPEELQPLRYEMAVCATILNGDACRFPRCNCPCTDCSEPHSVIESD